MTGDWIGDEPALPALCLSRCKTGITHVAVCDVSMAVDLLFSNSCIYNPSLVFLFNEDVKNTPQKTSMTLESSILILLCIHFFRASF